MSKLLSLITLLAASAHANDTTCGDDPDKVPNCDKPDHGSCGNACCILDMVLRDSPQAVYNQTVAFLKAGGYDGSFAYVTGPDAAGHDPDDYLGAGVGPTSSWWYIFQGSHSTTGGYIDTLNFFLKANAAADISTLRVGSISTIHGALGDHGQNYKTLSVLLKALGGSATIFHGCAG